jgi:hypothetical protein
MTEKSPAFSEGNEEENLPCRLKAADLSVATVQANASSIGLLCKGYSPTFQQVIPGDRHSLGIVSVSSWL